MPLPEPAPRQKLHERHIVCCGFAREDGLWDIEGHLTDHKTYTHTSGTRTDIPAGEPVHEMWLRLTVDDYFVVQAIEVVTEQSPYPATCPAIAPDYQKIVGLKIGPGWTRAVRERMGGMQGCTHLTELLGPIATTAFQTIYPVLSRRTAESKSAGRLALLNTCHTFDSSGDVVRRIAPDLYTGPDFPEKSALS